MREKGILQGATVVLGLHRMEDGGHLSPSCAETFALDGAVSWCKEIWMKE